MTTAILPTTAELLEIAGALARMARQCDVTPPPGTTQRQWARLVAGETFDAWLIAWPCGGALDFHDHGGSAGAIAVLRGTLTETTVEDGALTRTTLEAGALHAVAPDVVHDVTNEDATVALSVHVYSPPLAAMTFYDPADGRARRVVDVAVDPGESECLRWTSAE